MQGAAHRVCFVLLIHSYKLNKEIDITVKQLQTLKSTIKGKKKYTLG